MIGTTLGPYHVVAKLGKGGMGEVYKARDTRLDRMVAIKVLPGDAYADRQARERFEREARAISALDHPHICAVYDVGEHDGVHYLVMQHLEGETLAARLARLGGPLPLDQAFPIAIAIADALDRTHRAGITHRDLKPANIMLTKTGAKLLDFGLAKLRGPGRDSPAAPISMTGTAQTVTAIPQTTKGTILGTVPYMAPEQVEGREADARSDIWAFGAVLYEMATGQRPFSGDSPASVIGAILKDTPPPISARQPVAPLALDHLVERCLAKDPDERWQHIGDVRHEIEWIASNGPAAAISGISTHSPWRERTAWILAALALATLLLVTSWRWPTAPAGDLVRLSVNPPEGTALAGQKLATVPVPQFALSPDGRALVLAAAGAGAKPALWLRHINDLEGRRLPGTENADHPFWSPDSRWIAFFSEGRLKRTPAEGGAVEVLAGDLPSDTRGGSWGRDGTILFGSAHGPIHRLSPMSGKITRETSLDTSREEGSHRWPHFLPDGRHFLFTVRSGSAEQRGVYVGVLDGDMKKLLVQHDTNGLYAEPGFLLYVGSEALLARPFDVNRLELSGQTLAIAEKIGVSTNGNGAFAASNTGTLAHARSIVRNGRLSWFDRGGSRLDSVALADGDYADFRLSPDDRRLIASLADPNVGSADLWLTDLTRASSSRFTFGPNINASPAWSADGAQIVFRTNKKGLIEFYRKSTLGGGDEEPLLLEAAIRESGVTPNPVPSDWARDGRNILMSAPTSTSDFDLWLLPIADGKPVSYLRAPSDQTHGNFSPDGRFVAYSSNESGRFEVWVQTFPRSERAWKVSTNGGYEPRWRNDGGEIYYLSEDRKLMAVSVGPGEAFGVPTALFQTQVPAGISAFRTHYVPSRDGQRFLINTQSAEPAPMSVTVVLNWPALLKK